MAFDFYEATFLDFYGKTHTSRGNFESDANAKAYFNGLALKSKAKWARLRKIANVVVPLVDGQANPINQAFQAAAGAGSSVTLKGRCTFNSSKARNIITVEIPAVKVAYLTDDGVEQTTSPLQGGNLAKLRTEANDSAVDFRKGRFTTRVRR